MSIQSSKNEYYIMAAKNPKRMLLSYIPDPTDDPFEDDWLFGKPFSAPPIEPIVIKIVDGYEKSELMPYFDSKPVMSDAFYQTLLEAGVDNVIGYEAILRSQDGNIEYRGFKAVNIIGKIRAAGKGTNFTGDSRLIDASMDGLVIDTERTLGLLMFRLAEKLGTVVVNDKVKRAIEDKNFPSIVFRDPGETLFL